MTVMMEKVQLKLFQMGVIITDISTFCKEVHFVITLIDYKVPKIIYPFA